MPITPGTTGSGPFARQQEAFAAAPQSKVEQQMLQAQTDEASREIVDTTVEDVSNMVLQMSDQLRGAGLPEEEVMSFVADTVEQNIAGIPGGFAPEERDELAQRVLQNVMQAQQMGNVAAGTNQAGQAAAGGPTPASEGSPGRTVGTPRALARPNGRSTAAAAPRATTGSR